MNQHPSGKVLLFHTLLLFLLSFYSDRPRIDKQAVNTFLSKLFSHFKKKQLLLTTNYYYCMKIIHFCKQKQYFSPQFHQTVQLVARCVFVSTSRKYGEITGELFTL